MAHKKGGGSTRNGRGSNGIATIFVGGEQINAGGIIVRQVGMTLAPGKNVGQGKDFTLFALVDGTVKFEHVSRSKKRVSVYPAVVA